jgi:hypothetical protein
LLAQSIDKPPNGEFVLRVKLESCICVGVVALEVPILPKTFPSSSSVTAIALFPVLLIIVLSRPSPTRCANGGMVIADVVLYIPAGKNKTLLALISFWSVLSE